MLRAVFAGIAVSVLAAACALLPGAPTGTRPIQLNVRNGSGAAVDVEVTTRSGSIPGSAVPAIVRSGAASTPVIIYVPVDEEWTLELGSQVQFSSMDFDQFTSNACIVGVRLDLGGSAALGCFDEP